MHIEFARRGDVLLPVDPGDGAPAVAVGRMDLAQGGGNDLDLRMPGDDLVDHAEEGAWIELRCFRPGSHLRPRDAQALLQILFIADQDVDVPKDAIEHLDGALFAARRCSIAWRGSSDRRKRRRRRPWLPACLR